MKVMLLPRGTIIPNAERKPASRIGFLVKQHTLHHFRNWVFSTVTNWDG